MDNYISETMNFLQKLLSLFNSRRFWLLLAQAALAVVAIAAVVAPVFGEEIDTSGLPDEEALADRLMGYIERIVIGVGGIVTVLQALSGAKSLTESYTSRPPGVNDK